MYYFDVYTPDFSYSNWYNRSYSDESAAQLRYQVGWNSSKYHNDSKIRKLLLGMAKQTKWKLIDVRDLDGTGSIWSTMTDCEKDKELVFQKDFKCMLDQKTNTSACPASQTDSYDFYTNQDGGQIYLRFTDIGIPDDTFSFLIDVIEETVGTAKIKRLKVINLVSNGKGGIFTKA